MEIADERHNYTGFGAGTLKWTSLASKSNRGKKFESKPIPPILKFVGTVPNPARNGRFVPKYGFVTNLKPGSHMKITYIDPDFTVWFGEKAEEPTAETTLRQYVLTRTSVFAPAMKEIADGGILTKTTPGELYSMMEKQPDGPKSTTGPLLINNYSNLFEMYDVGGVVRIVGVRWDVNWDARGGGWSVCAFEESLSSHWPEGCQIFSRDSR